MQPVKKEGQNGFEIINFCILDPFNFSLFSSVILISFCRMTSSDNTLESIPADQQGSFSSFLKTLASFTGDLSSLTCPSFLLAPISLLEYS